MITIIEPIQENSNETEIVHLTTEIPFSIKLFGKRSNDKYISIVRNKLQIDTQTIFEHIETLSSLDDAFVQDFKVADFAEVLQVLSYIGKCLVEGQADDNLKIDESKSSRNDTPEVEDNSQNLETLASQISAIMKNPLLPERVYNAMTDELIENDIDADSPEYILGSLKKQRRKG